MPAIDARHVPTLLVAILVMLAILNFEVAALLLRRQDASVWVENATWLKEGEPLTVEVNDPGLQSQRSHEDALRSALNDCQLSGSVILSEHLAVPELRFSCVNNTPPPVSFPLPSGLAHPKD